MALLAALCACHARDVTSVPIDPKLSGYFFFVTLGAHDEPTRVSTVFGAQGGMLAFGGAPIIALESGEARAVIVSVASADLASIYAGFDASRSSQIAVALAPPPDAPIFHVAGSTSALSARLPSTAQIFGGSEQLKSDLLARITLTFPIDLEYCRNDLPTEMHPFGDTAQLLSDPTIAIPFEDTALPVNAGDFSRVVARAIYLDADHVLMLLPGTVFIVDRGRPIYLPVSTDPQATAKSLSLGAGALARSAAIDPAPPAADGSRRVLLAGGSGVRAIVWELSVSSAGLRLVSTATIHSAVQDAAAQNAQNTRLYDVAIDASGNAFAVGESDMLLIRPAGATAFTDAPHTGLIPGSCYRRLAFTGDPTQPHLIGEDNGVLYVGDIASGRYQTFMRTDRRDSVSFKGLAAADGGADLWAVGAEGSIFRRSLGTWSMIGESAGTASLELVAPPRLVPCASDLGGSALYRVNADLNAVVLTRDDAYIAISGCNAELRVRRRGSDPQVGPCASVLTLGGLAPAPSSVFAESVDVLDRRVLFGGRLGSLLEIDQ
jgi:hypothetical protein